MTGLAYVEDFSRGYTRRRVHSKWHDFNWRGNRVTASHVVDRLNAIGLPPAYRDVWFGMPAHPQMHPRLGTGIVDALARQFDAAVSVTSGNPGTIVSIIRS